MLWRLALPLIYAVIWSPCDSALLPHGASLAKLHEVRSPGNATESTEPGVTYVSSTATGITYVPASAGEKAGADALNAHLAANDAQQAAELAGHVALHSTIVRAQAQSALHSAQEVLTGAESTSDTYRRAVVHVNRVSRSVEGSDVSAGGQISRERELGNLQHELDSKKRTQSELGQMREEIRQLRARVAARRARADSQELEQSQRELAELESLLEDLEAAERKSSGADASDHDEMKAEVERLREALQWLEQEQAESDTAHEPPPIEDAFAVDGSAVAAVNEEEREITASSGEDPCDSPAAGGIDIDTSMPYGELEPFGREDTAQELTEQSVTESDMMVDQLERAEVAEEKRAVFRALTRLRGAAITSFDGIARSQTGNIDEYNKVHKWRRSHPLHHLADEESDISKWAFPDNADFVQKSARLAKSKSARRN